MRRMMRVLLAPGDMRPEPAGIPLTGEGCGLPGVQVAAALAQGWAGRRADDVLTRLPVADGGPGSAQAVPDDMVVGREALPGVGPLGQVREVDLLRMVASTGPRQGAGGAGGSGGRGAAVRGRAGGTGGAGRSGRTWFLDAARLTALPARRSQARLEAREGSTHGLGVVIAEALRRTRPADTLLVGLSRSAVHDGGVGALAGMGGPQQARSLLHGRSLGLVLADESPLGGMDGAGAAQAVTAGIGLQEAQELDRQACAGAAQLLRTLDAAGPQTLPVVGGAAPQRLTVGTWGTGAGGGTALVLRALGAWAAPGARVMARLTGLERAVQGQDLVVTAYGEVFAVLEHSPVAVAAQAAQAQALPAVLVAGRCLVPRGELAGAGVSSLYSLEPVHGGRPAWEPAWEEDEQVLRERLVEMGARLARTWSR